MIIKKISVQNYRSHKNRVIEFTEGINLLLGPNGSGKSSMLEALGFALFGADFRDNTKQSDAVSHGETTASVAVEFTGMDELDYLCERKIGAGSKIRLSRINDGYIISEDVASVRKKIFELAGLPDNADKIYQNVVTAYQNDITGLFLDKPAERRKLFDKIFDTDIYREMYEKFLKQQLDEYQRSFENKKTVYETKKNSLPEKSFIEKELKLIEKKSAEITKRKNETQKVLLEQKIKEQEYSELLNKNRLLEKDIQSIESIICIKNNQKKESERNLSAAKDSKIIVENTKASYDKYAANEISLIKMDSIITKLESKEIQKNKIETDIAEFTQKFRLYEKEIEHNNISIAEKNELLLKLKSEYNECLLIENNSTDVLKDCEIKKTEIKKVINDVNIIITSIKKHDEFLSNSKAVLKDINSVTIDPDELEKKITLVNDEIAVLNNKLNEINIAVIKKEKNDTIINDLIFAEKKLSGKICPYFNEDCKNMTGKNSDDYFSDRIKTLENENSLLEKNICEKSKTEMLLKTNESELTKIKEAQKNNLLNNQKVLQINNDIEKDIAQREKSVIELSNILLKSGFNDIALLAENNNQKEISECLIKILSEITSRADNIAGTIKQNKERVLKILSDIKNAETSIKQFDKRNTELASEITCIKNNINDLSGKLSSLINEIQELPDKKIMRKNILSENESLKSDYNLHLKSLNDAEKISSLENNLQLLSAEITDALKKINDYNNDLVVLKNKYSAEEHSAVMKSIVENDNKLHEISSELGSIIESKKNRVTELERITSVEDELKLLENEINILEKKIQLSSAFRENIKTMGQYLSERLIREIAYKAQEIYRQITGKNETIKWVNDSIDDPYLLMLQSDNESKTIRKFNLLSGGEQTALAIAMRTAMVSIMTKCRFVIFDEPTVNLDSERKEYLSSSLGVILSNVRQAIIVTHDDLFAEMAANVIRL